MFEGSRHLTLDRQFVEQAQRTPDSLALIAGDRTLTYRALERQTACAAAGLRRHGVGRGATVAILMDRSVEWVTAVLATLRAGATVLPLPPNYPPARVQTILAQAQVRATIRWRSARPIDDPLASPHLDLDDLCAEVPAQTAATVADDGDPERPAFVLCSSGSTGLPKMIVRSHRSFFHRLSWTWREHPFESGEVGCHKAQTTTTHGVYELFEPLLRGVPTAIFSDEEARNLERFWDLVHARGVTRLLVVPTAMQASLGLPTFRAPTLRVLVLMGEHVATSLARRIVATFPASTKLYSIYGSTEASSTLVCDLRKATAAEGELPLGQPIGPDIGVHVLDTNLQAVRPGQVGRLYVSGPALFEGYLAQPEATAQVILRHPRSDERLFDTRDDVRQGADGNLFYVGRADDTVKIRGFRVELAEVECAIQACPGVAQAAVLVDRERENEAVLVGFFTPRNVAVASVLQALRERLPPYMVPAALIGLNAFPLTERSKLDRRRLLATYRESAGRDAANPDFSGMEREVAKIWERTLGHRRFDRDSSFFEVGGTSLTTAVLVHRLREEFGLARDRVPEHFVYRYPTVATMTRGLAALSGGAAVTGSGAASVLVTLRRAADTTKPPLFCVASAGGTVGAYRKLAAALRYEGEVVGVRDPYVTAEREPTEDFDRWVDRYLEAIQRRQPGGPYCIVAYSSAGAFGYELAQRLRKGGAEVTLLALIDPLGIEGDRWWRYGWWVWRSTHARSWVRVCTRLAGRLRVPAAPLLRHLARHRAASRFTISPDDFRRLARASTTARGHLSALAALLELNSGLPVDLSDVQIPAQPEDSTLRALQARIAAVMPETDAAAIERIAIQYTIQAHAQRAYVLAPYEGETLLVEPATPYAGLIEAQLRPYLKRLRVVRIPLGTTDARAAAIARRFGTLAPHFLSMRDDRFAAGLAQALDRMLAQRVPTVPTPIVEHPIPSDECGAESAL
jgi:amino acid adenylation domain-containing protein